MSGCFRTNTCAHTHWRAWHTRAWAPGAAVKPGPYPLGGLCARVRRQRGQPATETCLLAQRGHGSPLASPPVAPYSGAQDGADQGLLPVRHGESRRDRRHGDRGRLCTCPRRGRGLRVSPGLPWARRGFGCNVRTIRRSSDRRHTMRAVRLLPCRAWDVSATRMAVVTRAQQRLPQGGFGRRRSQPRGWPARHRLAPGHRGPLAQRACVRGCRAPHPATEDAVGGDGLRVCGVSDRPQRPGGRSQDRLAAQPHHGANLSRHGVLSIAQAGDSGAPRRAQPLK